MILDPRCLSTVAYKKKMNVYNKQGISKGSIGPDFLFLNFVNLRVRFKKLWKILEKPKALGFILKAQ